MALPKYKNLDNFRNLNQINAEILRLQKSLFQMRAKKSLKQEIKAHLFIHIKRKIAQLNFKKSLEENS